MPPDNLRITPVESRHDLKRFIKFPYQLYHSDPHWIPPLFFERRDLIDPKKNPYFDHAQVKLFLAWRGTKLVGRISAQLDEEYEKFHKERLGHFGFFETEENPATAAALFEAAEEYLRSLGVPRMVGPFNYSINQESGLLIEGFDQPLMIMTPYNPPYYASYLESLGFQKAKDIFAWHFPVGPVPSDPQEIANEVKKQEGVSIRSVNLKKFEQDFKIMMDVFNSAWSKNWGYVPWTDKEIKTVAKEMKIILDPEVTFLIEVHGEAAGICAFLPNVYEIIGDLNGRLFPTGWAKFLYRLKTHHFKCGRLLILGVHEKFRTFAMGGLSVLLYEQINTRGYRRGFEWAELGWTLEDNDRINSGIEFMGGKKYKIFRLFEKSI